MASRPAVAHKVTWQGPAQICFTPPTAEPLTFDQSMEASIASSTRPIRQTLSPRMR